MTRKDIGETPIRLNLRYCSYNIVFYIQILYRAYSIKTPNDPRAFRAHRRSGDESRAMLHEHLCLFNSVTRPFRRRFRSEGRRNVRPPKQSNLTIISLLYADMTDKNAGDRTIKSRLIRLRFRIDSHGLSGNFLDAISTRFFGLLRRFIKTTQIHFY